MFKIDTSWLPHDTTLLLLLTLPAAGIVLGFISMLAVDRWWRAGSEVLAPLLGTTLMLAWTVAGIVIPIMIWHPWVHAAVGK